MPCGVPDRSASGDVGGEDIDLAHGPRPRECAAGVPASHTHCLTATGHSARLSIGGQLISF